MDKFWEWMVKKKYGYNKNKIGYHIYSNYIKNNKFDKPEIIFATKQMLIGYMIEYLAEKGLFIGLATASKKRMRKEYSYESIKEYFKRLEKEIEIEEENLCMK